MKAHRTDGASLAFAVVFGIVVACWAAGRMIDLPAFGWFVAGGLILFGVLGLTGALRTGWAQRGPGPNTPPDQATDDVPGSADFAPPSQDRPEATPR